jgi:hypothetical protein
MPSSYLWRNPWRSPDKPSDLGIRGVNEDRDVKVDHDEARLICRTSDKNITRLQIEMRHPICVYEGDSPRELVHEIEGDEG